MLGAIKWFFGVCNHKWEHLHNIKWNCTDFAGGAYQKLVMVLRCKHCGNIKQKVIKQ